MVIGKDTRLYKRRRERDARTGGSPTRETNQSQNHERRNSLFCVDRERERHLLSGERNTFGEQSASSEDSFQVYWATRKKPCVPRWGWLARYGATSRDVVTRGTRGAGERRRERGIGRKERGERRDKERRKRLVPMRRSSAAEWRGWSSLFIDFRSALVARTCIRGLDALFVPPQRFSFTLDLSRSPSSLLLE